MSGNDKEKWKPPSIFVHELDNFHIENNKRKPKTQKWNEVRKKRIRISETFFKIMLESDKRR